MTRTTSGSRVRPAIVAGELAGVGGRGVHLPVGGNDHGSHGAHHATAGAARTWMRPARRGRAVRPAMRPGPPAPGPGRASSPWRAADSIRSRARWTRPRGIASSAASSPSDASGIARRSGGHLAHLLRHRGQAAVGVERGDGVQLAGRRGRDPLQVRGLGVEEPVEVARGRRGPPGATRARGARSRRRPSAGRSRCRRRPSRSRRRARAGAGPPPAGRPTRAGRRAGRPPRARRRTPGGAARGPPRASPGPGTGRAARPPGSGRRRPPRRTARGGVAPSRRRRTMSRPSAGRSPRIAPGAQAGHLGRPVAGAGRLDRRQLGAQRRDEGPVAVRHRLRGPGDPAAPAPRLAAEEPEQGRGQQLRIVVVRVGGIDDVVEDEARPPRRAHRAASAA